MIFYKEKLKSLLEPYRFLKLLVLAGKYQQAQHSWITIVHFDNNCDWFVFNTDELVQYVRWDSHLDDYIYEGKPERM